MFMLGLPNETITDNKAIETSIGATLTDALKGLGSNLHVEFQRNLL